MKKTIIFAALAATLLCTSCTFIRIPKHISESIMKEMADEVYDDNNTNVSIMNRTIDITDFTKIIIELPVDVVYEAGEPSCSFEAPEKVIDKLNITSEDGVLRVWSETRSWRFGRVKMALSSSTLEKIEVYGAADFDCKKGFESENLVIEVDGAADMEMNNLVLGKLDVEINGAGDVEFEKLSAGDVRVLVNGAGDISIGGTAANVDVEINGAGDVDLRQLRYENVKTTRNGVGSIRK